MLQGKLHMTWYKWNLKGQKQIYHWKMLKVINAAPTTPTLNTLSLI